MIKSANKIPFLKTHPDYKMKAACLKRDDFFIKNRKPCYFGFEVLFKDVFSKRKKQSEFQVKIGQFQ